MLEWTRANGVNSVTPEDIAYVTGQNKIIAILRTELEKQKNG